MSDNSMHAEGGGHFAFFIALSSAFISYLEGLGTEYSFDSVPQLDILLSFILNKN
jgi:hypothetical protein